MNHKNQSPGSGNIQFAIFRHDITDSSPPPQVYASEGIRRESSQKVSDWTFKAADNNDQTAVTEVVKSDAYLMVWKLKEEVWTSHFPGNSVVTVWW